MYMYMCGRWSNQQIIDPGQKYYGAVYCAMQIGSYIWVCG